MTDNDPHDQIPVGETYTWQPQQPPPPESPPTPPTPTYGQVPAAPGGQGQPVPYDPYNTAGQPPQPAYGPQPQWYPPGPGTTYTPNATLPPGGSAPIGNYVSDEPKRSKGKLIGALGIVTVLIAGGAFAAVQLTGNDPTDGAASPDVAVRQFFDAINKQDVNGMFKTMLPGERAAIGDPLQTVAKQLQRLEVLDKSLDLNKVSGIDVNVKLTDVNAKIVNEGSGQDADIADVALKGTASATIDGAKVPIGSILSDNKVKVPDATFPDNSFDTSKTKAKTTLVAVKKNGRWFVSLLYTFAEAARKQADQDVPSATDAVKAVGGASPEKAMDAFLAAGADVDVEGLIGALNPNEAEALQRYAPLFLADTQKQVNAAKKKFKITVADASYAVKKIDGAHVGVTPKTLKVTVDVTNLVGDKQTETIELNDGCVKVTSSAGGKPTNSCDITDSSINDAIGNKLPGGANSAKATQLIDDLKKAFDGISEKGITETQVNGKWFISPIGTTMDFVTNGLAALDKAELQTLIDDFKALYQN